MHLDINFSTIKIHEIDLNHRIISTRGDAPLPATQEKIVCHIARSP